MHLNPKGAEKEVELDEPVQRVNYSRKSKNKCDIVSGGESQEVIDERMQNLIRKYSTVFSDKTGKCKGSPIKIQVRQGAVPVIQPARRIPLQYMDRLKKETSLKDQ